MDDAEYYRRSRKALKGKEIVKGFDYNGYNFQIDLESLSSMTGKTLSLMLDSDITEVTWITNTKDDKGNDLLYTFTRDEFIEFVKSVEKHYENIIIGKKLASNV